MIFQVETGSAEGRRGSWRATNVMTVNMVKKDREKLDHPTMHARQN
jgi:hypothetical protein